MINSAIKKTIKHLKQDNKDCVKETKEHNNLVNRLVDEPSYNRGKNEKRS